MANGGHFFFPSTGAGGPRDLVLEEMAVAAVPTPVTLAAEPGVSCVAHCMAELGYVTSRHVE